MEITNPNSASLSNYEVLAHLQKIKDSKRQYRGQLATITYETLRYLEETPCKDQTAENLTSCVKALEPFNMSKSEKLMLVNNPPISPLEIQLMIEESEDRLTEEQVQQILKILANHFPGIMPQRNPSQGDENSD